MFEEVTKFVTANPLVVLGMLVALVIILIVVLYHYHGCTPSSSSSKASFGITRMNNLQTGSNNPIWQLGSGDAGWGGSLHRETTPAQAAVFHPAWRADYSNNLMTREGLATSPMPGANGGGIQKMPSSSGWDAVIKNAKPIGGNVKPTPVINPLQGCPKGSKAVSYKNDDGAVVTYCVPTGGLPNTSSMSCALQWNPAATAEAQALATVGTYTADNYGELQLQDAINGAFNTGSTGSGVLSDDQLNQVLHTGGSP